MLKVIEAMFKIIDLRLNNNWIRYKWQRNSKIDIISGE
jgi:hypothetical protein